MISACKPTVATAGLILLALSPTNINAGSTADSHSNPANDYAMMWAVFDSKDPMAPTRVLLCSQEVSGDSLHRDCVQQLYSCDTAFECYSIGGDAVASLPSHMLYNTQALSVVGFSEALQKAPAVFRFTRWIKQWLKQHRPDCIILIDYPGLNLKIARYAKRLGIRVLFYVSPQIWAWRAGRIHTIAQSIDHMAVLFAFEQDLYKQANIPCTHVGHPLAQRITHGYQPVLPTGNQPLCIALLPGSRHSELAKHMPILLQCVQQMPQAIQFIIPAANSACAAKIASYCHPSDRITIIEQGLAHCYQKPQLAICASGTVTLELALYGIPQVVIYRTSRLSYHIGKRLIKTPYIALCNIVSGQQIVPELIQHEANVDNILQAVEQLLQPATYQRCQQSYQAVRQQISPAHDCPSWSSLLTQICSTDYGCSKNNAG